MDALHREIEAVDLVRLRLGFPRNLEVVHDKFDGLANVIHSAGSVAPVELERLLERRD